LDSVVVNPTPADLHIEQPDALLADLAVGWKGDHIKIGSITQSDRLAKYNRLLAIERETGVPLARWPEAAR